jgi:addiction module RelE/StbE family toxin
VKLRFSRRAVRNLTKIGQDLRAVNPAAAVRVEVAIHESLQNLVLFPLIGREQKTQGVRKLVTLRYPYLVYYTFDEAEEVITIISVKHSAQRREHQDA